MDETEITNYFIMGCYSKDQDEQNDLFVKGINKISLCLKDPDAFDHLAQEAFLIRYMIQSVPIFGDHVELILSAMLEFYHHHFVFMINFWQSLGKISSMTDHEEDHDDVKDRHSLFSTVKSLKRKQNAVCKSYNFVISSSCD